MNIGTKIFILFLTLILFSCKGKTQEAETKKLVTQFDLSTIEKFRDTKLKGEVISDYDNIFTPSQRKELSDILNNYNLKTTRQIAVVTIDSIKPYSDIQEMATDLGKYWGVGNYEKDNGIVIVFSNPEGKIGIATGRGTELVLTNDICKRVIDSVMIPEFKNQNFFQGIKNGVTDLIKKWK
jgi:uncharacterized protein